VAICEGGKPATMCGRRSIGFFNLSASGFMQLINAITLGFLVSLFVNKNNDFS